MNAGATADITILLRLCCYSTDLHVEGGMPNHSHDEGVSSKAYANSHSPS